MKILTTLLLFFAIGFFFTSFTNMDTKCHQEEHKNKCVAEIKNDSTSFIYLKSRPFHAKDRSDVLFAVNLKRNVNYLFSICDEHIEDNDLIVKILDKDEKLVKSSYDRKNDIYSKHILFKCTKPGKYWLKTRFKEKDHACASLIIGTLGGFKKLSPREISF